ncbi:MAG: SCO family protein [Gammaproteobacteria bacterium]|nr:SCO family protein [Gammaproteobacteria bacterium]
MRATAVCGVLILVGMAAPAAAQQDYDRDAALAISQSAIGRTIGDHTFRDVDGQSFSLLALRDKPLVVSLIYTSCHHVCPLITANIQKNVDIAHEALGADAFSVVSIGFDWQVDTPDRMRMYAAAKGIDTPGWHFLSGDEASVAAISEDVGFQYFRTAKGFDHLSQTTVIDADGKVYRQIYGQDFGAQAFVEPLKELVFDTPREAGIVDHWLDTFKLFCTVYDPNTGRYQFDYSIFMTILVGVLCLGAILAFIVYEWRHAK